jgi:hypothetical protein
MLALALALLVAAPSASAAEGLLVPRLSLRGVVAPTPELRSDGQLPSLAAPARTPSILAASAGFLAGDALALGVFAGGVAFTRSMSSEDHLGPAVVTVWYTTLALVAAPPFLGTIAAARTPPSRGSVRAVMLGGAVHVAGLVAAAMLWRNDHRPVAAGLLATVDLGLCPWLVVRTLRAARDTGDSE